MENEGILHTPTETVRGPGPILLLTEKWPRTSRPDEHNRIDILTSGITSLSPSRHLPVAC